MNEEVTETHVWSNIAWGEIPADNCDSVCWIAGVGWVDRSGVKKHGKKKIRDVLEYSLEIGLNEDGTWNVYPAALDDPDAFWWGSSARQLACHGLEPDEIIDYLKDYGFTSTVLLEGLRSSADPCLLNLACEIEAVLALRALGSSTRSENK
jgi:hypothetical protein